MLYASTDLMKKFLSIQGSDHKEFLSMLHKALEGAVILESFPKTTFDILHWCWNFYIDSESWFPGSIGLLYLAKFG